MRIYSATPHTANVTPVVSSVALLFCRLVAVVVVLDQFSMAQHDTLLSSRLTALLSYAIPNE